MPTKPGFYKRCVSHAAVAPSKAAIVADNREIDYRELLRLINAGAAFLTDNGIGRDATVGSVRVVLMGCSFR